MRFIRFTLENTKNVFCGVLEMQWLRLKMRSFETDAFLLVQPRFTEKYQLSEAQRLAKTYSGNRLRIKTCTNVP